METMEYVDAHPGIRVASAPVYLMALVAAYLLASGAWPSGFFFLVVSLVLYNALSPDKTFDII